MTTESLSPPLKWVGGKRWLVPRLAALYEPHRHSSRLEERFVGAMAVTLALQPSGAVLSDSNPHVINFYRRLRDPAPFTIPMENDSAAFYRARARFNELAPGVASDAWKRGGITVAEVYEAAELFYYLNRTCFNGVCRFNRAGQFNVPYGKYKHIEYRRDFSVYAPAMNRYILCSCDFRKAPGDLVPTDFVYADPPYDCDFTTYSGKPFTWEDQVDLAKDLARHPGPVVASNQATDRVLALYRGLGFAVETLEGRRSVSCNGDRTPALEMLATRNLEARA